MWILCRQNACVRVMDGITATQEIRRNVPTASCPDIAFTAYDHINVRVKCLNDQVSEGDQSLPVQGFPRSAASFSSCAPLQWAPLLNSVSTRRGAVQWQI
jgi:CheY-like chemotaxis protein